MKILQIINTLGTGGAEKLLTDSIPIYQSKGIKTDVFVLKATDSPLLEKLRNESNGKVMISGFGSVYNPRHIFKIRKLLPDYDLIHVHLFPSLYWTALAKIAGFIKTPLLFTEHSTSNRRREKSWQRFIDRKMYGAYNKIVTIADEVDTKIKLHLGFKNDRFRLIPNGIDTQAISNAHPYPKSDFFSQDDKILIQVSGFRPPKDQSTLIRSLQHLPQSIKLLLAGDGPLRKSCETLASELGLSGRIKFLGIRMDIPQLLKTSDIVVLSSHYEGLSLASLEAMASGRPFVASEVPGLGDLVKDTGLLFPDGDDVKLADQIKLLLDNKEVYDKTVARCQRKAADYDIQKMVESYIALYKEILQ